MRTGWDFCIDLCSHGYASSHQAHAARTKHQNFSESTEELRPLTEEEKKEQLSR